MTIGDLGKLLNELPDNSESRSLEEYLRALYLLVMEHGSETPTFELLSELLKEAFTSKPAEISESWLAIINPPDAPDLENKIEEDDLVMQSKDFDYLIEVLKFQISELYKMRDTHLKNDLRYFGITSEAGHSWYNFNPYGNLQCGTACMEAYYGDERELPVSWGMLGLLLEMGRIYE